MSVVGFDVGNESCIVAVARQRGLDVVLNDESKRETPAIVCFGEKQRFKRIRTDTTLDLSQKAEKGISELVTTYQTYKRGQGFESWRNQTILTDGHGTDLVGPLRWRIPPFA